MKPDGPGQSAMLLAEVVARLDALRIPYAVVDGLAALFHGVVRSSLDADEDFIAMKVFAGGPRNLDDARAALLVSSSLLDLPLLKQLASGYGRSVVRSLEQLLNDAGIR